MTKERLLACCLLSAMVVFTAGCGAGRVARGESYGYTAPPLANPSHGQLIVYRPKQSWRERAGSYPEVLLDDQSLGILRYNGYLVHEREPGQGSVRLTGLSASARKWEFRDRELPVLLEAGETVFVRVVVRYDQASNSIGNPGMDYQLVVSIAGADDARYELPGMRDSR